MKLNDETWTHTLEALVRFILSLISKIFVYSFRSRLMRYREKETDGGVLACSTITCKALHRSWPHIHSSLYWQRKYEVSPTILGIASVHGAMSVDTNKMLGMCWNVLANTIHTLHRDIQAFKFRKKKIITSVKHTVRTAQRHVYHIAKLNRSTVVAAGEIWDDRLGLYKQPCSPCYRCSWKHLAHSGLYKQPCSPCHSCSWKAVHACKAACTVWNPLHNTKNQKARPKVIIPNFTCHNCTYTHTQRVAKDYQCRSYTDHGVKLSTQTLTSRHGYTGIKAARHNWISPTPENAMMGTNYVMYKDHLHYIRCCVWDNIRPRTHYWC